MTPHQPPLSLSRSRSPFRSRTRSLSPRPSRGCTIVVERLTKNVTIDILEEIFDAYGRVDEVELPFNRKLGTHKGRAFISYSNPKHADAAIRHFDRGQIDGSQVEVYLERSPSPSPPPSRRGDRSPSPVRRGPGAPAGRGRSRSRSRLRSFSPGRSRSPVRRAASFSRSPVARKGSGGDAPPPVGGGGQGVPRGGRSEGPRGRSRTRSLSRTP